jgi:hypothetical protein
LYFGGAVDKGLFLYSSSTLTLQMGKVFLLVLDAFLFVMLFLFLLALLTLFKRRVLL